MLERLPDGVLVHLDLVRLAPDARVDCLAVTLDTSRRGGPERPAGILVPVPPDVPDQVAAAGRAGQEPGEPVLAPLDRSAVSPAVPRPHRLDLLPRPLVDQRTQR